MLAHAVAKHAKALGQKLKLQRGLEEEDGDDDDKADGDDERLWGANKKAYYGADEEEVGRSCRMGREGCAGAVRNQRCCTGAALICANWPR